MMLSRLRSGIAVVILPRWRLRSRRVHRHADRESSVRPSAPVFGSTRPGDRVFVEMRDGRREKFVVSGVEGDELVSTDNARYRRADIVVLKRHSFSPVKTTILVAGITLAVIIVAIGAAAGSALDGL